MARKHGGKPTPARALALRLTSTARKRSAYMRELIDSARKKTRLSPEEFAYAQVLAFGVVMCVGTLDEFIDRNLNSPHDIRSNVRDALRISAYELLFLKKPVHVVADQGVELVRSVSPQAAGLANAVLRKMGRDACGFPWGDVAFDDGAFARAYGVPVWFASELIGQHGRERAASILETSLGAAPTYMCGNPFKPTWPFASDLSAQFVASLVPVEGPVLEIGSGRGTKTMLMQARSVAKCGRPCEVHAVDLHEYRKELLETRMSTMGIDTVHAYAGDACDLSQFKGMPQEFSAVLVDAPCSGSGTLRRHPEIRWKLKPEDVAELAQLQLGLLCEAATRVAAGGTLVYATCSIFAAENQQVVSRFLVSEPGVRFAVEPIGEALAAFTVQRKDAPEGWDGRSVSPQGCFSSLPETGGPDGHFACRFVASA